MTWKGRGNNKVQCDRTGAIVHASDVRKTWDGLYVMKSAWYPRQPQDILPRVKEGMPPAILRPIGEPEYLPVPQPQPISDSGVQMTWSDGTQVEWSSDVLSEG